MAIQKWGVATPIDYPRLPKEGYYTKAFKKEELELQYLRELKGEWKALINAELSHILPKKVLKKVNNPTNYRLTS